MVEAITALLILIGVLGLTLRTLVAFRDSMKGTRMTVELLELRRVARHVLFQEVRTGVPWVDWTIGSGDSVDIRAFRGTGIACDTAVAGSDIAVRYVGLRRPDPAKDSVLALSANGWWSASRLVALLSAAGRCGSSTGVGIEVWRLDPPVPGAVVGRIFERGSYHLAAGALRYRRGFGGRQPITAVLLDIGSASGSGISAHRTGLELRLAPDPLRPAPSVDSTRTWPLETWP